MNSARRHKIRIAVNLDEEYAMLALAGCPPPTIYDKNKQENGFFIRHLLKSCYLS